MQKSCQFVQKVDLLLLKMMKQNISSNNTIEKQKLNKYWVILIRLKLSNIVFNSTLVKKYLMMLSITQLVFYLIFTERDCKSRVILPYYPSKMKDFFSLFGINIGNNQQKQRYEIRNTLV